MLQLTMRNMTNASIHTRAALLRIVTGPIYQRFSALPGKTPESNDTEYEIVAVAPRYRCATAQGKNSIVICTLTAAYQRATA